MSDDRKVELLYDRSCPVCELYCRGIDVDPQAGDLERIDAREPGELLKHVTATGLDIDEGMVVRVDDELYYGAEAIHQLAKLSSNEGLLNRFAAAVFRSRRRAEILYPFLKACRNLLLKLLGRTRINNLEREDNDRF